MIASPKQFFDNLVYREEMLDEAKKNPQCQALLYEASRRDRLYWINTFVWTYDPRRTDMTNVPLITYPFQDDLIQWDVECCAKGVDNLVEKSRDMGVTWCLICNDVHDWLFSLEKIEIKWGSRNQDYVDKRGEMDSVFEKIRYLLKRLPVWMLPKDFEFAKHDNFMRLINPETGSAITGEATSPNFGRGGRKKRIRLDEFAVWESDKAAWQAAADTTNCRTALSTVKGSANKFAELAHSKMAKKTLHWTQHPVKNKDAYVLDVLTGEKVPIDLSDPDMAFKVWQDKRHIVPPVGLIGGIVRSPWYDAECERRKDSKEIAEELDIDYLRSGAPFFDNRAVSQQQEYQFYVRTNPLDPIKSGHYVRGIVIDSAGKYTFREDSNGWLRLFEPPRKGGQYVVGGDVAEGLPKGDKCALVVRDKYTRSVCATVNMLTDPETLMIYAQKLGMLYNKALVAVENNNHGYSVNEGLKKMDCNLYWTRRKNPSGETVRVKAGWSTTPQSRPLMLDVAREEIRKQSCEVRDEEILEQMLTFVHNDTTGKPEADGDFKDDLVMAFAIAGQVINEHPYKPTTNSANIVATADLHRRNAGFSFNRR